MANDKKKVTVDVKYRVNGADDVQEAFDDAAESAEKASEATKDLNKNTSQLGSLFGGVVGKAGAMFTSLKKGLKVAINSNMDNITASVPKIEYDQSGIVYIS